MVRRAPMGLVLALAACPTPAARAPAPLREWLGQGCLSVRPGSVCEARSGGELRLWLLDQGAVSAAIDGRAVSLTETPRGGGRLLRVPLPQAGRRLTLEVRSSSLTRALEVQLSLVETATPAEPARRLAKVHQRRAFAAFGAGHWAPALSELDQGIALSADEPFMLRQLQITAAFISAMRLGDPWDGRARIDGLATPEALDGEGLAQVRYTQGQIASRLGEWARAELLLEEAQRVAERLELRLAAVARQERALALVEAGQFAQARETMAAALADPLVRSACWRADLLNSAGWVEVRDGSDPDAARRFLDQAVALYQGACDSPSGANNALLNLALLDERLGALAAARATLARVRGDELPLARLWRDGLEARIALASGTFSRARGAFLRLAERARAAELEAVLWQAQVGLGRVEERAGRLEAARAAYAEAEAGLDRQLRQAPLDRGQLSFGEDRAASADGLLRVLSRLGRTEEAFTVARRARRRALLQLGGDRRLLLEPAAQRRFAAALVEYQRARAALEAALAQAWQTDLGTAATLEPRLETLRGEVRRALGAALAVLSPGEQDSALRPADQGELLLLARPVEQGWWAWAALGQKIRGASLPTLDAAAWVAAFGPELRAAERVTVLASGEQLQLDLHSAQLDGAPLLAGRPVSYGLDLPPAPPHERAGVALLIAADPRGDLEQARLESSTVSALAAAQGWAPSRLQGREAGRAAVLALLGGSELFHYAGHARFAGAEGWQSALLLADGELSMGDILASPRAPRWVVLSACEGGASPPLARGVGLGLAQAFLAAGSEAVVAASPRVADRTARAFAEELYRHWGAQESLQTAYRRALLAMPAALRAQSELRLFTR